VSKVQRISEKCNALAKATVTPIYVGMDLSTLAGAAGIIAVKRIFNSFSESTIVIPDNSALSIYCSFAMLQHPFF
jgi:hypothetical protein